MLNAMPTVVLLILSNVFMTFAWYGHLKHQDVALWKIIIISWGIAFFEYCLMVPANRIGSTYFSAFQLKIIQEIINLVIFCAFAVWYLGEPLKWNYIVGFACIVLALFFVFYYD
jgi:uncharacterized protein (DUF486 family)